MADTALAVLSGDFAALYSGMGRPSRGLSKVDWAFAFAAAAYNLVRLPKLVEANDREPR